MLLVLVSTQEPLQLVVPLGHPLTHAPFAQTSAPLHFLPHVPQFEPSDWVSTQAESQSMRPEGQAHVPLHIWPVAQAFPQPPQLERFVLVSTQAPPQRDIDPGQVHCPETHDEPPPQTVPQPPQFEESIAVVTHLPPHNAWPDWVQSHRPATQTLPPPHTLPQAPQFALSVCWSMQASPQSDWPVEQGEAASMPEPASVTPPSGTGCRGRPAIQSRRQASSVADSGAMACGMKFPQVGGSTVTFS